MPIDERKDTDETKLFGTDQDTELKDLSAKRVDQTEEKNVKGGRRGFGFIATDDGVSTSANDRDLAS